jgi:FkbM family methyltransferase
MRTLQAVARERRQLSSLVSDPSSRRQLYNDFLLFRLLRLGKIPGINTPRRVVLGDGLVIHYRLNRGDIQSIREVILDGCYTLPPQKTSATLLDLGANIGLSTLWLARTYGYKTIVSVEPSSENAALVRKNFEENKLDARLVEAAVGPRDGTAFFADSDSSNMGAVSEQGKPVPMVSMPTLLEHFPERSVDLMKLDIEGGEGPLLTEGDLGWLQQIQAIVCEFHPEAVDCAKLEGIVQSHGMTFYPHGPNTINQTTFFQRT